MVKEGLTLAKTFIENRHGLFKSLNDDDATVQTHVSGDNLPPVVPLHGGGKARRSDPNMSLMKEPYFSDVYKMPTTAEGGVLILGDFAEKLRGVHFSKRRFTPQSLRGHGGVRLYSRTTSSQQSS